MEILVEVIGSVLEAVFGSVLGCRRIPRFARTMFLSILLMPFIVLCAILLAKFLCRTEWTGAFLMAFCTALLTALYVVSLRKIWRQ